MYVRRHQDQELTLLVSGKLWRDALVMFDRETESLWSQITGTAFRGSLDGTTLEPYPFEMTTWKEWRGAHPRTLVLKKEFGARDPGTPYASYFEDPLKQGIFGRRVSDDRLPPKKEVVAVVADGRSMVFPRDRLPVNGVTEALVGEVPIALVSTPSGGVRVYDRRFGDRVLALSRQGGALVAESNRSLAWEAGTGRAIQAENSSTPVADLRPVRAQITFWFGWVSFFPSTTIWAGPGAGP